MSFWSRFLNVFRRDSLNKGIDEELESHVEEAIERGRDPAEARRAFGSSLRHREECHDLKIIPWLDSVRADAVFGWRQLKKKPIASAAAVLSLALAVGACTSAFRLIDALLLRPLPVTHPERLYALARKSIGADRKVSSYDAWAGPSFKLMRAAVKNQAELVAVSYAERKDLTYRSDQEMEKAFVQYVSGWMFGTFGLRPTQGRLLMEQDDLTAGAHPYAVLSYDYWTRRFGQDPTVIGRTFRLDNILYEIVGVAEHPFTGTEPGVVVDLFLPSVMHPWAASSGATVFRTLAQVNPEVPLGPLRAKLEAISHAFEEERAKTFNGVPKESIDRLLGERLLMEPAASGTSDFQREYSYSLMLLGVLVGLVLLIACANVANLMTAEAAVRSRELALRVSIGAGRGRLVQLVLVECAWLVVLACLIGSFLAWWSPPFVIGMINPRDNPVRLLLPVNWRVFEFGVVLVTGVILLLGLAPALHASSVMPVSALKGGESPHRRRRLMGGLILVQVAFSFLILFIGCLFVATFERLSHRPLGFSARGVLTIETSAQTGQPPIIWQQVADRLRSLPGVIDVAIAGMPLMGDNSWNSFISINGAPPGSVLAYFLRVTPSWINVMNIRLVTGRDLWASDTSPGSALVNEAFAKQFFNGENPIGKAFNRGGSRFEVVGLVGDVPYRNLREPTLPQVYVPFRTSQAEATAQPISEGTFIVRTALLNPLALASLVRQEVPHARPEFRVSNVRTQEEINDAHVMRERLLARLASFFAVVGVLLSAIGIYGILDYTVAQRRREIGIRIALGARSGIIVKDVTLRLSLTVILGAVTGLVVALAAASSLQTLLYQVRATDLSMVLLPFTILFAASLIAALRPVFRAIRIDPVKMLRAE